jgi:hypothetical protein
MYTSGSAGLALFGGRRGLESPMHGHLAELLLWSDGEPAAGLDEEVGSELLLLLWSDEGPAAGMDEEAGLEV